MLLYTICYYYGKNNKHNIRKHLESFQAVTEKDKQIVIVLMIDDMNDSEVYKNEIQNYIRRVTDEKMNITVIPCFNWGGTIVALWTCYIYALQKYFRNIETCYIALFEEDFGCNNLHMNWYLDSKHILNMDNSIVYVGESTTGKIKKKNDDNRQEGIHINAQRLGDPEVWTDGGYYFSNLERLQRIENVIGIFHKGNKKTKYDHQLDGIDLGEVGFPTLLFHNNLKFTCLHRDLYFVHDWK